MQILRAVYSFDLARSQLELKMLRVGCEPLVPRKPYRRVRAIAQLCDDPVLVFQDVADVDGIVVFLVVSRHRCSSIGGKSIRSKSTIVWVRRRNISGRRDCVKVERCRNAAARTTRILRARRQSCSRSGLGAAPQSKPLGSYRLGKPLTRTVWMLAGRRPAMILSGRSQVE
jgi:hypothetical protein